MSRPPLAWLLWWSLNAFSQHSFNAPLALTGSRDRILDLAQRLPRYTCVQTVNRTYLGGLNQPAPKTSCDQFAGDKQRGHWQLKLEATDRLRLDVLVAGGQEVYSWPGADHYDPASAEFEFIGGGPVGTGAFGTFLLDIFGNESASFEFRETTQLRGKLVLEYAYQVPADASHYWTSKNGEKLRVTAFHGSFWVNPVNSDLERLTVLTSELPPETGACTADTRVDYQKVRLGTGDFLLPLESELHFALRDGSESFSTTNYSKCREYLAESNLSFADPVLEEKSSSEAAAFPIRNGLPVTLALSEPIDTRIAAAGDLLSAKVVRAVVDPASQAVVIPAGALVRGRIVRLEHRLLPSPHFLISISWSRISDHQRSVPFFARIRETNLDPASSRAALPGTRVRIWLPPPGESKRAGGWLILPTSKDHFVVRPGYKTQWLTASPP